ncbi:GSCOCG00011232001-RA-CDS, partial [Cotesia congregata]
MEDGASNDLLIPEDLPMTPKTTKFQTSPSLPKNSEIPTAPNQEKTMLPPLTPMQQKSLVSISKNQTAMETKERTKALKRTHSLTTKAIEIDSDRESENSYAASELEDNILNIDSQEPRVVKKKIKTDDRTDDQVWQDLENEFKEEQNFPMTIIQFKNLKDSAKGKHDVTEIVAEYLNVNGYLNRLENIQLIINKINPLILCLQETNFYNDYCASIQGFQNYYKNRSQARRASGGVAIYARPHSIPEQVLLNTNLEAIAIKIKYPYQLTICCIYLPNSTMINEEEIQNLLEQLPPPVLITGDFNSHHEQWGSRSNDSRDKIIVNWLDSREELILLNTGKETHFNSQYGTTSNIDLSITSASIGYKMEWSVADDLYDSDHFPIIIQLTNDS